MLQQYPFQNQDSEKSRKFHREIDDLIEQTISKKGPIQVQQMKPHILSDLCIVTKEKSLPKVKECTDMCTDRQVQILFNRVSKLEN